jgi:hypothetical protein
MAELYRHLRCLAGPMIAPFRGCNTKRDLGSN